MKFDITCLMILGFISLLGQVVLLREIQVAFYGIELMLVLSLGVWIFWTAVGAMTGMRTYRPSENAVCLLFLSFAVLILIEVAVMRACRLMIGGVPGVFPDLERQVAFIVVSLMPAGVLLGLLFQWSAKRLVWLDSGNRDCTLASAYAWESLGAVLGGLASTLLHMLGVQNFQQALVCAGISGGWVAVRIIAGSACQHRGHAGLKSGCVVTLSSAVTVGILAVAFGFGANLDDAMTRWNHPDLIASRDTPYGRITVTARGGQAVMFENDALAYETESTTAEEFVHLAAIHHESPKDILILGGGAQGLPREALAHSPRNLDLIELDRRMVSFLKLRFPDMISEPLSQGPVSVFFGDPRIFLKIHSRPYDLILIGMPPPLSAQANRFYTVEFFGLASRNLSPRGILAFRLPSSENLWTPLLIAGNGSVFSALKKVFEDVVVLPGTTNLFLASKHTLTRNPEILADRFKARMLNTRLVGPEYIRYVHTNDRFAEIDAHLRRQEFTPNSDAHPVCFRVSATLWLSKFFPRLIHLDAPMDQPWHLLGITALVMSAVFWTARRNPLMKRNLLAFIAGFSGMVFETVVMLHYQAKQGVLFQNIGLLFTVFMGGLATGAVWMRRVLNKRRPVGTGRTQFFGAGLFLLFSGLNLVVVLAIKQDLISGFVGIGAVLFSAAMLSAGVFSYASLLGRENQQHIVSPLYASDLAGGCIGAVVGSLFLVPFFGMQVTAGFLALVCLAGVILVF